MKKTFLLTLLLSMLCSSQGFAIPMAYDDLWDVSQGSVVTGTSGVLDYRTSTYPNTPYYSDIDNMFGAAEGGIEIGLTLLKDYMAPGFSGGSVPTGYTHWVEWQTPAAMTLRSFNLLAANEGMSRRSFSQFTLYAGDGSSWTQVYNYFTDPDMDGDYGGGLTYTASNYLELSVDITATTAQYFRAEFVQGPWADSRAVGPRVWELDGYDTFLDGSTGDPIPEPATMLLFGTGLVGLAGGSILRKKKK